MNNICVPSNSQGYPLLEATIARARNGRVLAKSFTSDAAGRFAKAGSYDNASTFDFERLAARNLAELASTLTALSEDRSACLLHGRAKVEGGPQRRRFHDRPREDGTVEPATIDDAPTALLCVDIDDCPPLDPAALAAMTPEQLAGYVSACAALPEPFWGKPCVMQLTGSHGTTPGRVRARLYFALDRALTWRERDALVGSAKVDRSVFRPAQCVYTARPIFAGGVDSYPERIFFVDTPFAERVEVPTDLAPAGYASDGASNGGGSRSALVEGAGWRRFLDAAEGHFFVEYQAAVGSFVAIEGPDADPTPLFEEIDKMLDTKARPARGADYVADKKSDAREWWRRCAAMTRAAQDPKAVAWDDLGDEDAPVFVGLAEVERALAELI